MKDIGHGRPYSWLSSPVPSRRDRFSASESVSLFPCGFQGRYHEGRRPSSDDSPTVIPSSALDKPIIMNRYHRRRTCSHTSPRRSQVSHRQEKRNQGRTACYPCPPGRTNDEFSVCHQGTRGRFNNAEENKGPWSWQHNKWDAPTSWPPQQEKKKKQTKLQLFDGGWRTGTVPQVWREAIMIAILKRGKDKSKAESYRPISLTSCVGKLMERLINTRLMWHLENKKHITPEQAAFTQDRSTEDQITYIAQAIEDAFQDKKHTLAVWIDLEKAFDKVWEEGLKMKLRQANVPMDWTVHGGVMSPTLFLIFIRDILHRMPQNIQGSIYADDLALRCSEEYITTVNYRLQQALQVIKSLARSWLVKVNEKKKIFTIFSLSNQKHSVHLKLNGRTLHQEDAPTYLGVTLDRGLTWKNLYLLWRQSQVCSLLKTDRKSKYWHKLQCSKTPGSSDARTHEPAKKKGGGGCGGGGGGGGTKKIQLPSAQQDPRKEELWTTGPYAQTHSISQDHPLLETRTTPKSVH